jgi:hypothetical protein
VSYLKEDSPSAQAHLTNLQGVIQRMATNSASCKAWSVALVSAILVIVSGRQDSETCVLIACIPALLFLILDGYYLSLERVFRGIYNQFVSELHSGRAEASSLVIAVPGDPSPKHIARSLLSFSVWPFYSTLVILILSIQVWGG